MNFAHWKTIPADLIFVDAEEFIVDIPQGTSRKDVIAKLKLMCDVTIVENDGFEFEEKWPRSIQREFVALGAHSDRRRSWLSLK